MLNRCEFIGHLGQDPEVKSMTNGKQVANLSLAVTEKWNQNGEKKEKTEWVRISVFSEGLIKIAQSYLKKGSKIYIAGKMQTRKWQDQSGADKYSTEIVLNGFGDQIVMLDSRGDKTDAERQREGMNNPAGSNGGDSDPMDDSTIPF